MVWFLIVLIIITADRFSKYIIVHYIESGNSVTVVDNFFYLANHDNYGAAWGIFQNGRYFFIILTFVISIFIIAFLIRQRNKFLRTSLSILLGGTIGNLLDRIIKGGVTDFLDFHSESYSIPVFNIADICILAGTVLLIIYMIFIYKSNDKVSAAKDNIIRRKDGT
jgi:lipoprotein signal peptidase